MEFERYTDEKHPEGMSYHVVDITEPVSPAPSPKRPLWRRVIRTLLTASAIFMLWTTFAPIFFHGCHQTTHKTHTPVPSVADVDLGFDLSSLGDQGDGSDGPTTFSKHFTFPPELTTFWIKQDSFHGPTRTRVTGKLIVHSCSKARNISTHFKFSLSNPNMRSKLEVEPHPDGIKFKLNPFSIIEETVNVDVFVILPTSDSYSLDSFSVATIELPILLRKTLSTTIETASFHSVDGEVMSLSSKDSDDTVLDFTNLHIATVSGRISGEFPLRHALDLESSSGSITASVISADLREKTGYIQSNTVSGEQIISFLGDLNPRPLYSTHKSVSGDISVHYPPDWQGGLNLKSTSGHIEVSGDGTQVVKKETGPLGSFWHVIKGDGKSKGSVTTVSGKIDVFVGEKKDDE